MGESVNCDESWMSGSKSGSADLNIGVVTRGGGGDRLDPGVDFLAEYRGRSGKNRWPFLSGGELVPSLGAWSIRTVSDAESVVRALNRLMAMSTTVRQPTSGACIDLSLSPRDGRAWPLARMRRTESVNP